MLRRAFTLIELLVVLNVIAVLVALLLPAVQKVREAANRARCANNLKQIGLAVHHYHDGYGYLPPARVAQDAWATWPVLILPYVEQESLYRSWQADPHVSFPEQSQEARETPVKLYFCPSRPGVRFSTDSLGARGVCGDYAACANDQVPLEGTPQAHGALVAGSVVTPRAYAAPNTKTPPAAAGIALRFRSNTRLTDITDGTSNTFLVGEKYTCVDSYTDPAAGDGPYYSGKDNTYAQRNAGDECPIQGDPRYWRRNWNKMFGSLHPGACPFVFCDGSVKFIHNDIDIANLKRLANRSDGEVITVDF